MQDHSPEALASAKRLRHATSLPEGLLWRLLRQRPTGLKFRRQHPVGDYIVDFYCAELRLVVEIDGMSHDMGDKPDGDVACDAWLRSRGLEVIRVRAADVLKDVVAVADSLVAICAAMPPPSALRAATSPSGGGI
jgi:very-short-patch-repair endonuclease